VRKALIVASCPAPSLAWAGAQASHDDPIAAVALSLAVILVTAKLGGDLAVRAGQPAVLGELIGGIVLGNLSLVGVSAFAETDPSLEMLARRAHLALRGRARVDRARPRRARGRERHRRRGRHGRPSFLRHDRWDSRRKAIAFLAGSLALGVYLSPKIFRLAATLRSGGVLLAAGLSSCFFLAWLANAIGLAAIVGAFAAGLILDRRAWRTHASGARTPDLGLPRAGVLRRHGSPRGSSSFTDPAILGLAVALTLAAIAGKQACSLAVIDRGLDRLSV
jgi:hypothetical protein